MTMPDLHAQLTTMCARVLKRPALGPDEGFVELGMDSVAAVEIVNLVESNYGVDIVDAIFDSPTVNRIFDVVDKSLRAGESHAV